MLQRVSAHDADEVPAAADAAARDGSTPQTLEQFLGGVGPRGFRFAEMGLRQREDALDAVQDAMLKMLGYRDLPAARSEEHTSELQSLMRISYAVFCLTKIKNIV